MSSRILVSALAAASLLGAAAPALAQGRGYDRNPGNNPDSQQARPEDRSNARRDAAGREARREPDHRQPDRHRDHRGNDHRGTDHRGNDRRDYGYVVPRPNAFYYSAPPAYYPPPVYYGGVPQTYYNPYAYSAPPVFRTGDYLPAEYLGGQYAVLDWQWRGLSAPPWGYQWVLLGPDNYALVAMGTGQIVSVVVTR